jgi:hypothetical protein
MTGPAVLNITNIVSHIGALLGWILMATRMEIVAPPMPSKNQIDSRRDNKLGSLNTSIIRLLSLMQKLSWLKLRF